MTETAHLDISKLSKSFGTRRVLRQFSLVVGGGEVVAVVGPNGSGKSTLLKMVAGLLRPSSGQITWAGQTEAAFRRAQCAYAAPDLMLYPELTGRENLRFFDTVASRRRTNANAYYDALFAQVGLSGRDSDRVHQYSSGMRQRLRLAFALLADAPLLLLDEPSLALDAGGVEMVEAIVADKKARNGIVLLATNDAREAAWGSRSIAMGA